MLNTPPLLFDRRLYALRRRRAMRRRQSEIPFLVERSYLDIVDRLETATRTFDLALFWGAAGIERYLTRGCAVRDIVHCDLAPVADASRAVACDDEAAPFADSCADLVVSVLMLHHANDLPGALAGMRRLLKPDGLFLAVLFGETTLSSVRQILLEAEGAYGGASMRVSPMATVRDLGGLMQRAGFALPVADVDKVRVNYRSPATLISDLRNQGDTAVFRDRPRQLLRRAARDAMEAIGTAENAIEFDLVTLTGWAPHPSQRKPLQPGSAVRSMKSAVLGANSDLTGGD